MSVLCVLCLAVAGASAQSSGLGFSISTAALSSVTDLVTGLINHEFSDLYLPPYNVSIPVKDVGAIDVQLTNITIQNLHIGDAVFGTLPPSSVNVTLPGLGADISLNFRYSVSSLPAAAGTGVLTASPKDGVLNPVVTLGVDGGKLTVVAAGSTYANFGNLEVDFTGPDATIYNLIWGEVATKVTEALNTAVAQEMTKIVGDLNNELAKLPTSAHLDISDDFDIELDLSFVTAEAGASHVAITNKLGFANAKASPPAQCPLKETPLPLNADPAAEFQLALSDTLLSCPLWFAYTADVINVTVTPTSEPSLAQYLNTTFFKDFVPPLYAKYPNAALDIGISLHAPFALETTAADGFVAVLDLALDFSAVTAAGPQHAMTLGLALNVGIDVNVNDTGSNPVITLDASEVTLSFAALQSSVGTIDVTTLNSLAAFAGPVVKNLINKKLAAVSVTIPSILGISLKNPEIVYADGAFVLAGSLSGLDNIINKLPGARRLRGAM